METNAEEVIEMLERFHSNLDNQWWNCNGGTFAHQQIRDEQAEVQALIDRLRGSR